MLKKLIKINIKKAMPDINKYIRDDTQCILPSSDAHLGLNVPEVVLNYGNIFSSMVKMPHISNYMIRCMKEMKKSYSQLYNQPSKPKKIITDEDISDLGSFIIKLGIEDIGFTQVDTSYIFKDKKILYNNAIVLLTQMKPEIIKTVPSKMALKEIFRTYYTLNYAVNMVKDFLNKRGYNAEAGPALGGEVNYPLLAQQAGLGVIGKHGLLITPDFGSSLRLAAVYTDIENLPKNDDNQHIWVREFCNNCNRCVDICPCHAIYKNTIVFDDGSEQHIDYKKCAMPFSKNYGCTICVKECVFFGGKYDKIRGSYLSQVCPKDKGDSFSDN